MTSPSTIGEPVSRVDGRLKVTGGATYAAEFDPGPELAYGVIVGATVAHGRIVEIDVDAAEGAAGVVAVLTHRNAPRLPYGAHRSYVDPAAGERLHVLQNDRVRHQGQPIALVVADTFEQATHGASLVRVAYDEEPAVTEFADALSAAVAPGGGRHGQDPAGVAGRGDADGALGDAPVRVDAEYVIPRENHNPIELHATVAAWQGDTLTLWDKSQWVDNVRDEMAAVFGIPAACVRVVSPFVGGAFGSALRAWPHVALAALAARHVGRPVKVVLTRRQMFTGTGYRPHTVQRVAVGADREGKLVAIRHECVAETSTFEQYTEHVLNATRYLYACPNVATRYRLAALNVHSPAPMRAPGAATGNFALECALDELATTLGMDPIELRLRNDTDRDPDRDVPFSSRALRECLHAGAERFGWDRRDPRPASMRDARGHRLGYGCAAASYPVFAMPARARALVLPDGSAIVSSATSDMGPGTYTAMRQVAAATLGLPLERVVFELGDTRLSPAPAHGGSATLGSVGSAVQAACAEAVRLAVARDEASSTAAQGEAPARPREPTAGATPPALASAGEAVDAPVDLAATMRRIGEPIEAMGRSPAGEEKDRYSLHAFGAVFAEVAVDPDLGMVRVPRIVGAYGTGRVVNPKLARSQVIGGMVMGLGMALMERTAVDARSGRVVGGTLAEYLVPVSADIHELDAVFVREQDRRVNPLGVKGVAELATVGVAAAIANAVYHATGRRVRELPITPDDLLDSRGAS